MDLDSKLEKVIKKQVEYKSSNLGLNLLISRLQRKYSANQSPDELGKCLDEIKTFINKYASILGKDIEELKRL